MPGRINIADFHLAATLECGQAFRWTQGADGWFTGIVGREVWRLRQDDHSLLLWERPPGRDSATPVAAGRPLPQGRSSPRDNVRHYLSLDRSLRDIVATFPKDPTLHAAVHRHWGLRVLRQEPWETLASFIASSTKQIVQIRQIVELLAQHFGEPIAPGAFAFPTPAAIARATLPDLLACKLGFRAKYLLAAARAVDDGRLDLAALPAMELPRAREELLQLNGVGEKIANCALLFGCGHDAAFPVDVWMQRALKKVRKRTHFGPYAGWAQQYLFYAERNR